MAPLKPSVLTDEPADFTVTGPADAPGSQAALWEALVSGKWTIFDSDDRPDGRRCLLLRRNEKPEPLSGREREVVRRVAIGHANKTIAIDLGVTSSAVARTLARALRKLGLKTRLELVLLLPGSAAQAPR